jgi:CheY-like chemotaxis protein
MTKRVLIVDDEDYIREVIKISLETLTSWDVRLAESGTEGLAMALAMQPDVILLDMMMPGMDGLTTLGKLQAQPDTQGIPVILLTASSQGSAPAHPQSALKGAIAKPFDPLLLAGQVATLLGWVGED